MPRFLNITDHLRRDAIIKAEGPRSREDWSYVGPSNQPVRNVRLVKATEGRDLLGLTRRYPDPEGLARALVEGDPEVDLEHVGRRVGSATQVWIGPDGKVLYAARALRVTLDPHGAEIARADFIDKEATVLEDRALPWTGRLVPVERVVRNFAFSRKYQLRHINGLTFDYLHAIAKHLQQAGAMLLMGAGDRGNEPLVFQRNGSPFRGFLEGRADDTGYRLVLHLSNLELKRPVEAP
jgi:hypothetical protein